MSATTVRSQIRMAQMALKEQKEAPPEEVRADDGFTSTPEVRVNPLGDFMDDQTFAQLQQHRLFDAKSLRDFQIRKTYREMRKKMTASDALDKLQELYSYLQYDTIRKIVYMSNKAS